MRGLKALLITIVTVLAVATPAALSQRDNNRLFPVYDNGGKPDLVVDPQRFVSQMEIVDRNFDNDPCAVEAGAVGAKGYRRLLRFDTVVMNSGDGDLIVGDRSDPKNPYAKWFESSPCHDHAHIRDFSLYELLNADRTVVIAAHKQGFCIEDSLKYDGDKSNGYNSAFQGITSGWADWNFKQLTGQWIDITGVPEGDYIVRVSINTSGAFDEGSNKYVNSVETSIHIPNAHKKILVDNSPPVNGK